MILVSGILAAFLQVLIIFSFVDGIDGISIDFYRFWQVDLVVLLDSVSPHVSLDFTLWTIRIEIIKIKILRSSRCTEAAVCRQER